MSNYVLIALTILTTCKTIYNSDNNAIENLRESTTTYCDSNDSFEYFDNDAEYRKFLTWKLTSSEATVDDINVLDVKEIFTYTDLTMTYQDCTPQGQNFINNTLYPYYKEHYKQQEQIKSLEVPNPLIESETEQALRLHRQKILQRD